jgi:hypothetical protein
MGREISETMVFLQVASHPNWFLAANLSKVSALSLEVARPSVHRQVVASRARDATRLVTQEASSSTGGSNGTNGTGGR